MGSQETPLICSKPPEAHKRKGWILCHRFQREHDPADILISDVRCERNVREKNVRCVKPPSLWYFVQAALEN